MISEKLLSVFKKKSPKYLLILTEPTKDPLKLKFKVWFNVKTQLDCYLPRFKLALEIQPSYENIERDKCLQDIKDVMENYA